MTAPAPYVVGSAELAELTDQIDATAELLDTCAQLAGVNEFAKLALPVARRQYAAAYARLFRGRDAAG